MVKNPFAQQYAYAYGVVINQCRIYCPFIADALRIEKSNYADYAAHHFVFTQVGSLTYSRHTILARILVRRTELRSNQMLPLTSRSVALAYSQCSRSCSGARSVRSTLSCLDPANNRFRHQLRIANMLLRDSIYC